jgi:CxxC motif-containing protein (DUF1111 family)
VYRESLFRPEEGRCHPPPPSQFEPAHRQPPALFGTSLLESVTEADLLHVQRVGEQSGVSGRIGRGVDGRPARFGWKGQTATLATFVTLACANELGLGTPRLAQPRDPTLRVPPAPGPDMTEAQLADLVAFVASLPPPPVGRSGAAGRGRSVFVRIGCASCHAPRIGAVEGAWTDLLLHDLGPGLSEGESGYSGPVAAEPNEWRTPPLWGVARSAPYLHDGRAPTLDIAIRLHGGEATRAADRYAALRDPERDDLLAFLESLGEP